jgi:hypothetical protein
MKEQKNDLRYQVAADGIVIPSFKKRADMPNLGLRGPLSVTTFRRRRWIDFFAVAISQISNWNTEISSLVI